MFLLTIGTLFLGNYELINSSTGIYTARFSNGTPSTGGHYCRGYFFTPTEDLFVQSVYGNISAGTFTLGVWNVTSHNESGTVLGSRIVNHTMSNAGVNTFNQNNLKFSKNQTYLIVQGRTSDSGSHTTTESYASNNIPFITFNYLDARLFGSHTTCNFSNSGSSTNYPHSSAGSTRVDVGFTYLVNSINFNTQADGVSEPTSIIEVAETDISNRTLPSLSRTGYTFNGWYTAASGGTQITQLPTTMPSGVTNYYAQWSINSYTISFDSAGGSVVGPITQNFGTNVVAPSNPTKEGYTFNGWSQSVPSPMPANNTSLTAQWNINNYTITFDSAGGSVVNPINQDFGTNVTAPNDPTRVGYLFSGWDQTIPSTIPSNNLTITAQWTPITYQVNFYGNDASEGSMNPVSALYDQSFNLTSNDFSKVGHTFLRWNTQADGQGDPFDDLASVSNLSVTSGASIDLFAQWTINNYTLDFESNGGTTVTSISADYATSISLISPSRIGYDFIGWFDDVGLQNSFANTTMPALTSSLVSLYAMWSPLSYSVTLDHQGGTSSIDLVTATFDQSMPNITSPTKAGFTFLGYFSQANGEGTRYYQRDLSSTTSYVTNQAITLFAHWAKNRIHLDYLSEQTSVTSQEYNSNVLDRITTISGIQLLAKTDGSSSRYLGIKTPFFSDDSGFSLYFKFKTSQVAADGMALIFSSNPLLDSTETGGSLGFPPTFEGSGTQDFAVLFSWYLNSHISFRQNSNPSSINQVSTSLQTNGLMHVWIDYELTATGGAIKLYLVNADENQSDVFQPLTPVWEQAVSESFIANEFYLGITAATGGSQMNLWLQELNYRNTYLETYTLQFDSQGGSSVDDLTASFNSDITLPAPTMVGYTFSGWYLDSGLTQSFNPSKMPGLNNLITTLYAKWQINAYTLSFNSNGGSAVSDLTANYQSSIELPNPTRLGYRFDGWTENATSVNFTSMPLGNRTLTATWTPLIYTLTLINSMTNEQTTITTNFGLPIQLPQINQPGYTFGGWLESNRPVRFTTMPSGNRTLVASFNARSYPISFSSEKGTAPASIQGAYRSTIQLPVMNVEHFIFKGWQGPDGLIQGSFQVPLNGASFTAVFEPKLYTISFVAEGVEVPNLEVPFDTPITLPTPSKAGYRFTGWTFNGTPYSQTKMPGENLTLTATFEKVELILRLVSEGRTIRETTLYLNDSFTLPTAQKRGYTFDGWYEGNTRIRDGVMPARNLTLEARFLINSYPVTFVDHNSTVTERFVYEGSVPLPVEERLGYRFIGWARNGQIIDQLIMTDAVIELSAVYQPLMASMTFITPLQQIEASITTNQPLTNLNALNVPEGYTWLGYFSSPFGVGEAIQSGRMIDNAHDTMMYPYYLRAGQVFDSSSNLLSTEPYYFGNLETPVLSSKAFPWFETITFITTSLALIGLYVISKGAKWDEKIQ